MNTENSNIEESDEITIKELFQILGKWKKYLWSKKIYILLAVILFAAIGATIALLKKTQYKAEITFALEENSPNNGGVSGLASLVGINLGGGGGGEGIFNSSNILTLMQSRTMIVKTLLSPVDSTATIKTSLLDYYIDSTDLRTKWKKNKVKGYETFYFPVGVNPDSLTREQNGCIIGIFKQLTKNNLDIGTIDKKSTIMQATCTSEDEVFSKRFIEELLKNVSEFYITTKTQRLQETVNILQQQANALEGKTRAKTYAMASTTDNDLNPSKAVVGVPIKMQQMDAQISGSSYAQVAASLESSKMSLLKETPLVQVVDAPIYPLEKIKPGLIKYIVLFAFVGFVLSAGFFVGKKYLQDQLN